MNVLRYLRTAAKADINAITCNSATLATSEQFSFSDADQVGFVAVVGTASGDAASLTVTAALELSPDGGTSWIPSPAAANSPTGASAVATGTDGEVAEFWPVMIIQGGKATNALGRFVFTYGGGTTSFTNSKMWLSLRKNAISP